MYRAENRWPDFDQRFRPILEAYRDACAALEAAANAAGDEAARVLAPVFETVHNNRNAGHELEYDRLRQKLGDKTFGAFQVWLENQAPKPAGDEEGRRK